jgi:phosphoribulokinase
LLAFYNRELYEMFDVRVYLDPPEELRRHWKVQRDCSRRGYTTDQVLAELDRREPDSETFIRPQRHNADLVVSFQPVRSADQEHLDCKLTLRDSLPHPDLAAVIGDGEDGVVLTDKGGGVQELYVPGRIKHERAHEIEEAIWERMRFARHLREQRLGEFTIGTELHRSDSLGVVQLLILYHLVCARAAVATGHGSTREMDVSALAQMVASTETVPL